MRACSTVTKWNETPEWAAIVASYEPTITRVATKYSAGYNDDFLMEDVKQECRIALFQQFPEKIRGYDPARHGPIVPGKIPGAVDRYLKNVCRNAALSWLHSRKTG